jgi:hypothetical protein
VFISVVIIVSPARSQSLYRLSYRARLPGTNQLLFSYSRRFCVFISVVIIVSLVCILY